MSVRKDKTSYRKNDHGHKFDIMIAYSLYIRRYIDDAFSAITTSDYNYNDLIDNELLLSKW